MRWHTSLDFVDLSRSDEQMEIDSPSMPSNP